MIGDYELENANLRHFAFASTKHWIQSEKIKPLTHALIRVWKIPKAFSLLQHPLLLQNR